jgi:hypothetical protein
LVLTCHLGSDEDQSQLLATVQYKPSNTLSWFACKLCTLQLVAYKLTSRSARSRIRQEQYSMFMLKCTFRDRSRCKTSRFITWHTHDDAQQFGPTPLSVRNLQRPAEPRAMTSSSRSPQAASVPPTPAASPGSEALGSSDEMLSTRSEPATGAVDTGAPLAKRARRTAKTPKPKKPKKTKIRTYVRRRVKTARSIDLLHWHRNADFVWTLNARRRSRSSRTKWRV